VWSPRWSERFKPADEETNVVEKHSGMYRHCTCYLGPGAARCGARAPFLCDFPVGKRTCDRPLCADHATEEGPDRHYCPEHVGKVPLQGALF
jgi:hypothetical protein